MPKRNIISFFKFPKTAKMSNANLSSCESNPTNQKKVIILGSGPNRIGQGIKFIIPAFTPLLLLRQLVLRQLW